MAQHETRKEKNFIELSLHFSQKVTRYLGAAMMDLANVISGLKRECQGRILLAHVYKLGYLIYGREQRGGQQDVLTRILARSS